MDGDYFYQLALKSKDAKNNEEYLINIFNAADMDHQNSVHIANNMYINDYTNLNFSKYIDVLIKYNSNKGYILNLIGLIYENKYGIEQDYKKAIEYYLMAIEKGNDIAIHNIGDMYRHGHGVKKDYNKAIEYYLMAIEKGNASALNNLGYMYEHGKGVAVDYKRAIEYYLMAIEKGNDVNAMLNLGDMYENGNGVKTDYKKTIEYYLMASEKGSHDYDERIIAIDPYGYIRELLKIEKENKLLKDEIDELMYRPEGPGYIEAKTRFESMQI